MLNVSKLFFCSMFKHQDLISKSFLKYILPLVGLICTLTLFVDSEQERLSLDTSICGVNDSGLEAYVMLALFVASFKTVCCKEGGR